MATITRRQCLTGFLLGALGSGQSAFAQPVSGGYPSRIFAAEWARAETLVAIGMPPVATGDAYQMQGGAADGFSDILKIGSIFAPNLEELQRLKPDLILCADWQARLLPDFQRIAPTHVFDLRNPPSHILQNAIGLVRDIGNLVSRPAQSVAYIDQAEADFDAIRRRLERRAAEAVLIGTLEPDGRHLAVYETNNLLVDTMRHVGVGNAWKDAVASPWGIALQGVEILADYPDATFLYLDTGPRSATALRLLQESTLWQSLPIVQSGRVRPIPFAWPFGGVPTALKFAETLAVALNPSSRVHGSG